MITLHDETSHKLSLSFAAHTWMDDGNFNNLHPDKSIFMQRLAHPSIEIPPFIYTIIDFCSLVFHHKICPDDDEHTNLVSNDCERTNGWMRENVHQVGWCSHSLIISYDFPLFKGLFGFSSVGSERKIGLRNSAACALFYLFVFELFFWFWNV